MRPETARAGRHRRARFVTAAAWQAGAVGAHSTVMNAAFRHGEGTGRGVRAFPLPASRLMRAACACLLLYLGAAVPAAHAGNMYRCEGARGETVFTSHKDGYTHCKAIDVGVQ